MATSALSILTQIFYEPKAAFEELKDKPRVWLPLILIPALSMLVFFWYFATVDFPWLVDHMLSAQPNLKPDAREMLEKFFTKNSMMFSTMGGVLVGTAIMYALTGLYFLIASKVMGSSITYGKWFAFAAWTSVPGLLGIPLMALQIITGEGKVSTEDLNMLSLNFLTVHLPLSNPWSGLLNSFSLTTIWTAFLAFVGLRVWTGRSVASCAIASVLPYALIYGIWAAKIAFFK